MAQQRQQQQNKQSGRVSSVHFDAEGATILGMFGMFILALAGLVAFIMIPSGKKTSLINTISPLPLPRP